MTLEEQIYAELLVMGITRRYRGCTQVCIATVLAMQDAERLHDITEQIYKVVASRCGTRVSNVERNIRTVCQRAWRINRRRMSELAGYPLYAPPAVSDFISILATHMQRTQHTADV